jgi:hypothetical protein
MAIGELTENSLWKQSLRDRADKARQSYFNLGGSFQANLNRFTPHDN